MGKSKTYNNVTRKRWSCMKLMMRKRIETFAKKNGYQISIWSVPEGSDAIWHIVLKSKNAFKPALDFTARISHDQKNQQATIELIRMPGFISMDSAIRQVNSLYLSCKA